MVRCTSGRSQLEGLYLQKQSEQPSPRVVMTRGLALHRVERAEAPNCRAYVGFGQARQSREQRADGTESLGELLPDLEVGPVEVPCGALGGMIERDALRLPDLADDESDEPETRRLQFTPVRDEDGLTHYDATEFRIYPIPQRSSTDVTVKATAEGAGYLANQSALLLEEKKGWKKIRLQLEQELMIEGWVDAALFEPEDGSGWPDNHGGWLGGGGYSGKPPTYCSGKLAAGTRIETAAGVAWATVSREIEGIFIAGRERHRLVNFLGPYRDAFCAPQWYSQDTQGHHACLERAEVRSENVTLVCPAPKIR